MVCEGCPGHGPIHLLSASDAEIGFSWNPDALAGLGLICLSFAIWLALFSISWMLFLMLDLCGRKGFRGGPLLDIHGSLQLLDSSHVGERDKALLRSIMVGGVWNVFLLGRVRGQVVPVLRST